MNPDAQRKAIARHCRPDLNQWPIEWFYTQENDWERDWVWMVQPDKDSPNYLAVVRLPDYLADLNACAQMEKSLTDEQRNQYAGELECWGGHICYRTAPQRCEAFLRTLGLWVE